MGRVAGVLAIVGVCLGSGSALAQERPPASWGVVGTFVPKWQIPSNLEVVAGLHFSEDDLSVTDQDLRGDEFRIGIVRGRPLGGDWGVSFVRRRFVDSDTEAANGGGFSSSNGIYETTSYLSRVARTSVQLTGIEAHKFIGIATIANRVQVGLNVAGGVGRPSGQVAVSSSITSTRCRNPSFVFPDGGSPDVPDPCSGPGATIISRSTQPAGSSNNEAYPGLFTRDIMPIGRFELGVGVAVVRQLTLRVAGGLNYPGTNDVTVSAIYLFGAR